MFDKTRKYYDNGRLGTLLFPKTKPYQLYSWEPITIKIIRKNVICLGNSIFCDNDSNTKTRKTISYYSCTLVSGFADHSQNDFKQVSSYKNLLTIKNDRMKWKTSKVTTYFPQFFKANIYL